MIFVRLLIPPWKKTKSADPNGNHIGQETDESPPPMNVSWTIGMCPLPSLTFTTLWMQLGGWKRKHHVEWGLYKSLYTKTFQSWPLSLQDYKFTSQSEIFCFNPRGSSWVFPCFPIYIYTPKKDDTPITPSVLPTLPRAFVPIHPTWRTRFCSQGLGEDLVDKNGTSNFFNRKCGHLSLSLSGGLGSNPSFGWLCSYLLPAQKLVYCQK